MYIIDKTFSLLVIQSLLAVYLLSVYNEARLGREGNILDQWNGKARLKIGDKKVDDGSENTLWANMFKKFYKHDGDTPNELKDTEFYNFIEDLRVFFNTFLIVLAFGVMVYIFCSLMGKTLERVTKTKTSHVLQPGKFDGSQSARSWLENFELYLEEDGIQRDRDKCSAMLSRLSGDIKTLLKNYNPKVADDYKILRESFIKIYGGVKKTLTEYQIEFALLQQGDKNLYQYHSELKRLAGKAFPELTDAQKESLVTERFINGITNQSLRTSILATRRSDAEQHRKSKDVLEMAAELNEIFGRSQVDVNAIDPNRSRRGAKQSEAQAASVCYGCGEVGHYKYQCPKGKSPLRDRSSSRGRGASGSRQHNGRNSRSRNADQGEQQRQANGGNMPTVRLNNIEQTNRIAGYCKVDGKTVKFLADSGASKTCIDVRLLDEEQRKFIKESPFVVVLADGTETGAIGAYTGSITLGKDVVHLEMVVTERLHEGCLLGLDFLQRCPSTRTYISALRGVLESQSDESVSTIGANMIRIQTILGNPWKKAD